MTHILAIANQKGGVGKTTTCVNLAAALARQNKKALVLDLDPQGNASVGFGVDRAALAYNTWHWFEDNIAFEDVVVSTPSGVDVLASDTDLTAVELSLLKAEDRNERLRSLLAKVNSYDYILIDCPPALNVLTINALMAATAVLVPMQCEYFALEGLSSLLDTLDAVRESGNPDLHIDGILRTMYDPRMGLTNAVSRQLFQYFDDQVYRTVIPRNVRLAEAPSHGQPINIYDGRSRGSIAYMALASEIMRKHEKNAEMVKTDGA